MNDEVRFSSVIGGGVRKQMGRIPTTRRREKVKTEKTKKPAKEIESGKSKTGSSKTKGTHGETKTGGVHGESPINVPSERIYPNAPKEISKSPKALEAPGSFVGTPVVNLNEGSNFGKIETEISRVPRQFRK
jgi:hypothetical protein